MIKDCLNKKKIKSVKELQLEDKTNIHDKTKHQFFKVNFTVLSLLNKLKEVIWIKYSGEIVIKKNFKRSIYFRFHCLYYISIIWVCQNHIHTYTHTHIHINLGQFWISQKLALWSNPISSTCIFEDNILNERKTAFVWGRMNDTIKKEGLPS